MSITLERPQASLPDDKSDTVEWTLSEAVRPPVWVGYYKGVYLGMIEHRDPEGYTATTHRGRNLGSFEGLEDAQRSFYR